MPPSDTGAATGDGVDVVVLDQKFHGLAPSSYAAELRDRLPDHEIRLAATPAEERELLQTATVATGTDFGESLLEAAPDLQLFACAYAGTDHLPIEGFRERGVAVTNAAGVHGPNVSEQAIGFVLAFARRLREAWRRQQRREWRAFQTGELAGSTVTIVGLGAIGQAIARRLDGFAVETIGVRHSPEKDGPVDEIVGYDELDGALARTDYLLLACPLTEQTQGLIDDDALGILPPQAVVVNVARGEVIDTDALVSAIRGNRIAGAGLDVTDPEPLPEDHPLWNFENVQITPHNAGFTPEYHARLAGILAENLRTVEETGEYADLKNQVVG
ncbi:MAG: D-2-hydroxyacid dehydrogenase [Haloarculaceae archaeon]